MFLPWRNRGTAIQKQTYPSTQNMVLKWFQLYCIWTIINYYYVLFEYISSPSNTVHIIESVKSRAVKLAQNLCEKALKIMFTKAQCATLLWLLFCLHCKSHPYPETSRKTHTPPSTQGNWKQNLTSSGERWSFECKIQQQSLQPQWWSLPQTQLWSAAYCILGGRDCHEGCCFLRKNTKMIRNDF